jgi:uncharacterized membrane protein YfcA
MFEQILYTITGLISGFCMGTTSFNPLSIILLVLDSLNIGSYKKNIGSLMIVNTFPIAIGSAYEFYIKKQINYPLAWNLIVTVTLGSYLGSMLVTNKNYALSDKQIKYFTGIISIIFGIIFLVSAFYSKDKK